MENCYFVKDPDCVLCIIRRRGKVDASERAFWKRASQSEEQLIQAASHFNAYRGEFKCRNLTRLGGGKVV